METEHAEIFRGRLPTIVRTELAALVQLNGPAILDDPKRVKAMLSDTVATARREINLISLALSEGVSERLIAVSDDPLRVRAEMAELTQQLVTNHALHEDAARWSVESCAWSLGLGDPPEDLEPGPRLVTEPEDLEPSDDDGVDDVDTEPVPDIGDEVAADAPPATAVAETEPTKNATVQPRPEQPPTRNPRRVRWIVAAAAVAIVAVVTIAVVATRGHGGAAFTAAEQRLMTALPAAAPRDRCQVHDRLDCDIGHGFVNYQSFGTEQDANLAASLLAPLGSAAKPWTTTSGDTGGLAATDTDGRRLAWSFRVGSDVWEGEADFPDTATLNDWWRTNVIASPELTPMTVDK